MMYKLRLNANVERFFVESVGFAASQTSLVMIELT